VEFSIGEVHPDLVGYWEWNHCGRYGNDNHLDYNVGSECPQDSACYCGSRGCALLTLPNDACPSGEMHLQFYGDDGGVLNIDNALWINCCEHIWFTQYSCDASASLVILDRNVHYAISPVPSECEGAGEVKPNKTRSPTIATTIVETTTNTPTISPTASTTVPNVSSGCSLQGTRPNDWVNNGGKPAIRESLVTQSDSGMSNVELAAWLEEQRVATGEVHAYIKNEAGNIVQWNWNRTPGWSPSGYVFGPELGGEVNRLFSTNWDVFEGLQGRDLYITECVTTTNTAEPTTNPTATPAACVDVSGCYTLNFSADGFAFLREVEGSSGCIFSLESGSKSAGTSALVPTDPAHVQFYVNELGESQLAMGNWDENSSTWTGDRISRVTTNAGGITEKTDLIWSNGGEYLNSAWEDINGCVDVRDNLCPITLGNADTPVDGSFEVLRSIAATSANSDLNSNVNGAGWHNGINTADSFLAPFETSFPGNTNRNVPESPDGGVFAGAVAGLNDDGGEYQESFYTDMENLHVGVEYTIRFWQSSTADQIGTGNGESRVAVGNGGAWEVHFGDNAQMAPTLTYQGDDQASTWTQACR